jgi:hypothetical protein
MLAWPETTDAVPLQQSSGGTRLGASVSPAVAARVPSPIPTGTQDSTPLQGAYSGAVTPSPVDGPGWSRDISVPFITDRSKRAYGIGEEIGRNKKLDELLKTAEGKRATHRKKFNE